MQTVGHCKSVLLEHMQYIVWLDPPLLHSWTLSLMNGNKSEKVLVLLFWNSLYQMSLHYWKKVLPPSSTGRCRLASHSGICNTVSTPAHLLLGPHVAWESTSSRLPISHTLSCKPQLRLQLYLNNFQTDDLMHQLSWKGHQTFPLTAETSTWALDWLQQG